jgi:hypothetical protein
MKFKDRIQASDTPRRIYAFKLNGEVCFYNRSLFRWLSIDGGIRGNVEITHNNSGVVCSGVLPEGVFISKLHSKKFGAWTVMAWGYVIEFDAPDNPLWDMPVGINNSTLKNSNQKRMRSL